MVRVPSRVFRKRLTETYGELLQAVLVEVGMSDTHLEFLCTENEPVPAGNSVKQTRLDFDSVDHQLNPRYMFETFVVGASNQFAHAAAQAVAEQPSKAYNPLFLYGGVGMGKTHLMQAVGHLIKKRNPAARLTYISAEKFTNEVINSLRFDRMISFRDRFRSVDVLLGGRYSVHRRQGTHAGRVLSHLQRALRPAAADHGQFRLPAEGNFRD